MKKTKYLSNEWNGCLKRIKDGLVEVYSVESGRWNESIWTIDELNHLPKFSCIRQITRDEARRLYPLPFRKNFGA